ncbi:MAG: hypothetical protein ACYDBY_13010 [Thermoanaerobaculia bacterium]
MSRDDLFEELESPSPPAGLREVALRAGRRGMHSPASPDAWSRLWRSPAARLAWGAAVLLLAFAHARVPQEGRTYAAAAGLEPELSEVAHLSRIAENSPRSAAGFTLEGGPL